MRIPNGALEPRLTAHESLYVVRSPGRGHVLSKVSLLIAIVLFTYFTCVQWGCQAILDFKNTLRAAFLEVS